MPPRTIDNLGREVSTRYAEDQKIFEGSLIKESQAIPVQTEIEVTSPFLPSEVEALFHAQPTYVSWAFFTAPAYYFEQRKKLFTFQMIPSLGSEDKKESQAQKILNKLQTMEEKERRDSQEQDKRKKYEELRALEEEEKEKKILTSLLTMINFYDKLIIDINSRRSQYQKG
jgi:hypothetical protein